ncbi:MAG: hypothetical protein ABSH51_14450 [Solirubrobacteraceae bacterium]
MTLRAALVVTLGFAAALGPAARASAAGVAAPGLPGPPPGAATGLPPSPSLGAVPAPTAAGPARSLPGGSRAPGLRTGMVTVRGTSMQLSLACHSDGRVVVTAGSLGPGSVAAGSYRCRHGSADPQLTVRARAQRRLTALRSTLATAILHEGASSARISLSLSTRVQAARFWSDGGLQCDFLGARSPYLVAPDFTDTPATIIDVRPWIAWYTPGQGWRWLGTDGLDASQWYRWTAGPTGIAQWTTPTAAVNPWTWGPITVAPGDATAMIGAFEIVYRYAQPTYAWGYVSADALSAAPTTYCRYP